MCAQCMAAGMTAVAGASGARVWLGLKRRAWLTPRRVRAATLVLAGAGLAGASLGFGGA